MAANSPNSGATDPIERRILRAGLLSLTLEAGGLRWIRLGDLEVIRAVAVAVRDPEWDTVTPSIVSQEVVDHRSSFEVRLRAEHVRQPVDFAWEGSIEGLRDGTIRFAFRGIARSTFMRARLGFNVVHPGTSAGEPIEVVTPWGSFNGRYPTRIARVSMFNNIRAIRQPLRDGATLEIAFEGELFETEDQRNFGDDSFKTYGTPLCIPYPVRVDAGDTIEQCVTVSVAMGSRATRRRVQAPLVDVGVQPAGPLPAVGLSAIGATVVPTPTGVSLLRSLAIDHLRVEVDADRPTSLDQVSRGERQALAAAAPVELVLVSDSDDAGNELAIRHAHDLGMRLARILVFDRRTSTSTRAGIASARAAVHALGLSTPVGGGSRAWFDLLNMTPIPVEMLDLVAFGMSPQAHARDDATIMENAATLTALVESALAIGGGGRPLAVGPVAIAYPFNPWASDPEPGLFDGLPYNLDRRQPTLFGAAWTIAALAALARPGVASVTLREWAGMAGVVAARQGAVAEHERPRGPALPVFHVLADLRGFDGTPNVIPVEAAEGRACLALHDARRTRVILANLRPASQQLRVRLRGSGPTTLRVLDRSSVERATREPVAFRASIGTTVAAGRPITVDLSAYAVATLERLA